MQINSSFQNFYDDFKFVFTCGKQLRTFIPDTLIYFGSIRMLHNPTKSLYLKWKLFCNSKKLEIFCTILHCIFYKNCIFWAIKRHILSHPFDLCKYRYCQSRVLLICNSVYEIWNSSCKNDINDWGYRVMKFHR